METTRREAIGLMGAAAVTAVMAKGSPALAERKLRSSTKTLFWVPSVTPCDKNLKFDPGAYKDIIAWLKHNGADGIVVLGTTGEFPSFSVAERKQIAETALKNKLGMNMIVNPGTANFTETLELAQHAEANGADGLLVIPPFYYKDPPTEGLTRYYSMLFDQIRIPINLYHIPEFSGVPISIDLLHSLEHYPNLAGIKDSNGPAEEYEQYATTFPNLNMRTGTDNNIEAALGHGMGAIVASGNVLTRVIADIFTAYRTGQDYHAAFAKAQEISKTMEPTGIGSYGPMKYALSLAMGGPQTYQRPPLVDVTETQKAAIQQGLEQVKQMMA